MKVKRVLKWSAGVVFLTLVLWLFIAYWTSTNDCNRIATPTSPMKAILNCEYGVENLQLRELDYELEISETTLKNRQDFLQLTQ